MIHLFIRPVDTQFHRSGLPFDAGEDTEADSIFPPFPEHSTARFGPRECFEPEDASISANSLQAMGASLAIRKGSALFSFLALFPPG